MAKRPSEERGTGAVIRLVRNFCQAEILIRRNPSRIVAARRYTAAEVVAVEQLTSAFGGAADMTGLATGSPQSQMTQS